MWALIALISGKFFFFFEMQVKMQAQKGKKQVSRVLAEKAALFS